jgi:tRNA threonylcarbamoyladenosine biosynthesis protein TsaE
VKVWETTSTSAAETRAIGSALGRVAPPTLVVGLQGDLGAGKTTFVRGVAEGAGVIDPRLVTSPTFILVQEYVGRLPIYHFDTYRLPDSNAFEELGAHEYFADDGLCLVEWSDRFVSLLPADRLDVSFTHLGDATRRIRIDALGARAEEILNRWRSAIDQP